MEPSENKKNPKGLNALIFIQIFATFSFSVLLSTLVLFATKKLKLDSIQATTITASFVAFNYTLHLFAGFVSGRFCSHRTFFLFGMVLQLIGCVIISFVTFSSLLWGLSLFLAGSGFSITCINCLLTQFFKPTQKKKLEKTFLFNYSAMNLGFMLGFAISGIFEIFQKYQMLFLVCALSSLVTILGILINWKNFYDKKTYFAEIKQKTKKRGLRFLGFSLIILLIFVLRWLIKHADFSNDIILFFGIFMCFVISFLAIKEKAKVVGKKIWAYLILSLMSLVFWTLYLMAPMGLVLFIEHNVRRTFLGFSIPPQWFQNINAFIIILGAPLLAYFFNNLRKKGVSITIPLQFSSSLVLIGIGFLLLPLGISFANRDGLINISWIIACYTFQSIGELFISPIGYAMIGQLIPPRLQGLMMGSWMMVSGVAAVLSNKFSKIALKQGASLNPLVTNKSFSSTFIILGSITLFVGLVTFFIVPFLHRLIRERKRPAETPTYPI